MNQIALALEQTVYGICQIAGDLAHPQPVCDGGDTGNLNAASGQLDKEQNHEAPKSLTGPNLHCEKSAATICTQCWARNSFQVVFRTRSGAGSMAFRFRMLAIVP